MKMSQGRVSLRVAVFGGVVIGTVFSACLQRSFNSTRATASSADLAGSKYTCHEYTIDLDDSRKVEKGDLVMTVAFGAGDVTVERKGETTKAATSVTTSSKNKDRTLSWVGKTRVEYLDVYMERVDGFDAKGQLPGDRTYMGCVKS